MPFSTKVEEGVSAAKTLTTKPNEDGSQGLAEKGNAGRVLTSQEQQNCYCPAPKPFRSHHRRTHHNQSRCLTLWQELDSGTRQRAKAALLLRQDGRALRTIQPPVGSKGTNLIVRGQTKSNFRGGLAAPRGSFSCAREPSPAYQPGAKIFRALRFLFITLP